MSNKFDRRKPNRGPEAIANGAIRFPKVRVGELGVMDIRDARAEAESQGLDLVLITDKPEIPVCKIVDLNKFLYEKKKREKEAAKKQRESRIEVKEVQFRPNIDTHDFETKMKNVVRFVDKGNHVKLLIRFRGREMANTQAGFEIINRVMKTEDNLSFESKPQLNGNRLIAIVKRD